MVCIPWNAIAVRATGHGPIRGVDHGLLIDTRAISTIAIDPARRTTTVGAGATWTQVLTKCAPFGLIPLCGSSPDVGVASYTLGGGLSPLGRRHGLAADRVHRIRLVPADGRLREITADTEPELFWAVRGGGGNIRVATELEFDLVPGNSLRRRALPAGRGRTRAARCLRPVHGHRARRAQPLGRLHHFPRPRPDPGAALGVHARSLGALEMVSGQTGKTRARPPWNVSRPWPTPAGAVR